MEGENDRKAITYMLTSNDRRKGAEWRLDCTATATRSWGNFHARQSTWGIEFSPAWRGSRLGYRLHNRIHRKASRMKMKTALAIIVLSATPVFAQGITNTRDANGNLPRDKGISTNTNPTNANTARSSQSSTVTPPPAKPTTR